MSYQVLARKYRPHNFRELVGQEHAARALINALDQDRLHHAYLFTGTRGVGKTTIARILAKCLNCETGVTSEPCGVCSICREIDEGRFVDLIEVDAASRTKVEDTRELLDNVQYAPTRGRYKVYLIDEVHMLSGHSFNALLKTLEEPPPHVKFLLATTDPQKLPITILSRCLQFALKSMSPERVIEHLTAVLQKEGVPFEESALWELGRAANGSMRDALSLTDQAIAFGNGKLTVADVRTMLGSMDRDLVFRVLEAVNAGDAAAVLAVCAQLVEQGVDFAGALSELVSALHRVALAQMLPEAVDNALGDRERLLALAQASTAEDVQLYYQVTLQGRRDLPWAADPRSGFEMTLLRMLAFRPLPTGSATTGVARTAVPRPVSPSLVARTAPQSPTPAAIAPPAAQPATQPSVQTAMQPLPTATPISTPRHEAAVSDVTVPTVVKKPAGPAAFDPVVPSPAVPDNVVPLRVVRKVEPVVALPEPVAVAPEIAKVSPTEAATVTTSVAAVNYCTPDGWEQWLRGSGLSGASLNLARHAALVALDETHFELQLADRYELLANDQSFAQIEETFRRYFPTARLKLVKKDPAYTVPMQIIAERKQARFAAAEQSLRNDPMVRALLNDFQAEILPDSITLLP